MNILTAQGYEQVLSGGFSPEATRASNTVGRARVASADPLRNDFQKDRDKIIHSKAFRRLSHKTQVFLAVEGDHYRTRLTHTLEVSQIARTIARGLGLNEDLAEAISLGHDLGHTPFGHSGEDALRLCLAKEYGLNVQGDALKDLFRHNVQSLRVVDVLEQNGQGLNLTAEVRDGIVRHTGSERAATLEGRIVATADRIAYVNHDIDDAIRAGMLREEDLPEQTQRVLGTNHADRIQTLVLDMVHTSAQRGDIALSDEVYDALMNLRKFLFTRVYKAPTVLHETEKALRLITCLFNYYLAHADEIPEEYHRCSEGDNVRAVADYIAGMTDRYAISVFEELHTPRSLA